MAGNANSGRRQERPFRDALRIEALSAENGDECAAPKGSLRWNARRLLEQGDVQSIRELADRLDGKVAQAIVGDDEMDPINLVHRIERHIVRPPDPNS
jgi:hypothetical protein